MLDFAIIGRAFLTASIQIYLSNLRNVASIHIRCPLTSLGGRFLISRRRWPRLQMAARLDTPGVREFRERLSVKCRSLKS